MLSIFPVAETPTSENLVPSSFPKSFERAPIQAITLKVTARY